MQELGLEGKVKARAGEREICRLLDPQLDAELPDGRSLWQDRMGDVTLEEHAMDGVMGLLGSALDVRPGHFPRAEHETWKDRLGLDDTSNTTTRNLPNTNTNTNLPNGPAQVKTPATQFLAKTAPLRNSAPASPRNPITARPERAGKKRRYDESSYEGYEEDGYSTGGVDEAGGGGGARRASAGSKRQKRKVSGRLVGY